MTLQALGEALEVHWGESPGMEPSTQVISTSTAPTCESGHIPGREMVTSDRRESQEVSQEKQCFQLRLLCQTERAVGGRGAPRQWDTALEAGRCVPEGTQRCSGEAPGPRWTEAPDKVHRLLTPGP